MKLECNILFVKERVFILYKIQVCITAFVFTICILYIYISLTLYLHITSVSRLYKLCSLRLKKIVFQNFILVTIF
jgi:hypothetical protein